jgi:hypothetical protein
MRRFLSVAALALLAAAILIAIASAAGTDEATTKFEPREGEAETILESGALEFNGTEASANALTQCPQAGLQGNQQQPRPLNWGNRRGDEIERISGGNDQRANQDFSCQPQNETSIDVNPRDPSNVVGGANDYRIGTGLSGFYSSTDTGNHWYDGLQVVPSQANADIFDAGGDPAVVFDRDGVVYYADIGFNRTNHSNGVFVHRSTNGGFTWSRPRVGGAAPSPRLPGDGVVDYQQAVFCTNPADPQDCTSDNEQVQYDTDKEYIAAGPRPTGVSPQCFTQAHTPTACDSLHPISSDRLYVTWTRFTENNNPIYEAYSDDQARSWSPAHLVSTSASFCAFGAVNGHDCDSDQDSAPTVGSDGTLYVAYENFNTPDENQYLVSRSKDGGNTFEGPFFVSPMFDQNYPVTPNDRPDCAARGLSGRRVLTNSCFRVSTFGNIVADPRGGAFADDLYLVFSDNRFGTKASSNTDIFLFKSVDGGTTWIGPTRVNDDPSANPADRDCNRFGPTARRCPQGVNTGNDQWYPWLDMNDRGDIVVGWEDRRLDTTSTASEWPTSRSRAGNYLVWFWGGACTVRTADSRECVSSTATVVPQPSSPCLDPRITGNTCSNPSVGLNPLAAITSTPFDNFQISDVPSNWDYSFGNGIFAGDYSGLAVQGNRAYTIWTDARNGRGSGNPTNPATSQPGRNPACEQSDVFYDSFATSGTGVRGHEGDFTPFLVSPCVPGDRDKGQEGNH